MRTANMITYDYRWASETGAPSLPYPEELLYLGYEFVMRNGVTCRDPWYISSVLMRRRVT